MLFPDTQHFLILGAMKSGTTSLYRYLDQHPNVRFSEPKEPIFFEAEWERGLDYYRDRYFQGWSGEHAVGDARTHNLGLPFVAPRIRQSLPDARLVAILRNPVDRAYSEWWHLLSLGLETSSFEEAIDDNLRRIEAGCLFEGEEGARTWARGMLGSGADTRYGMYLDFGYYARHIERYLSLFPASQLEVVLFEDLSRDPEVVTRRIWKHLGVDPDHPLSDTRVENPSRQRVRSPLSARIGRGLRRLPHRDRFRRLMPGRLARRWREFMSGRPSRRPPMAPETERALLDHFEAHNRALETLLGRELPDWFTADPARTASRDPDGSRSRDLA
jgi:hypothetical protein